MTFIAPLVNEVNDEFECNCDGPCGSYVHDSGEETVGVTKPGRTAVSSNGVRGWTLNAAPLPSAASIRYSIERSW